MSPSTSRFLIVAAICVSLLIWGTCLWPTLWVLEKVSVPTKVFTVVDGERRMGSAQREVIYRVNRITGASVQVVDPKPPAESPAL